MCLLTMSYYAVHTGKIPGIYNTWSKCFDNVHKFPNARYKKFKNRDDAEHFLKYGENKTQPSIHKFFQPLIDKDTLYVYTDGSCIHNGTKDARAGYGIYFGKNDCRNVSNKLNGKQTNNRAELSAAIEFLKVIRDEETDLYANSRL